MRIGGSGLVEARMVPSGAGIFRGNDIVSNEDRNFYGYVEVSAVAAQYSHGQIFNPAASGIALEIDWIFAVGASQTRGIMMWFDTELTTDDGAWVDMNNNSNAGLCHIRSETNVAQLGTKIMEAIHAGSNPHFSMQWPFPIQLAAGEGLLVVNNAVNADLHFGVGGREV